MANEARIAVVNFPLWNQTSRSETRSVATAVNGIGKASIRTSSQKELSWARIFSAHTMAGALHAES
nr:hypothetical protein [Trueperella pecoris]